MTTFELLNLLEEKQDDLTMLVEEMECKKRLLMPAEVLQQIEAVSEEYSMEIARMQNIVAELRSSVDTAVIREGYTVKGDGLMAIYNKGRETWDSKLLSGFALAYPKILDARKVGSPSVSIRKI